MKQRVRKNFIVLFTVLAVLCLGAAFALFDVRDVHAEPAAETPMSPCDGTHSGWTELTEDLDEDTSEKYCNVIGKNGSNYYLTKNTKLKNNIKIFDGANVTVCLNGYIVNGCNPYDELMARGVISVGKGATLNICDCSSLRGDQPKHFYNYNASNSSLWEFTASDGSYLTEGDGYVTGGVITGGNNTYASACGGGIANYNGTVNMYGGAICGNRADNNGGGVFIGGTDPGGAFNMYGGTICGNVAYSSGGSRYGGGGVCVSYKSTFDMYGGTVSGNSAPCGGGVAVDGTFNMTGGEIVSNYGGGVYAYSGDGKINLSGNPRIVDNVESSTGNKAENIYFRKSDTNQFNISIVGMLTPGAQIGLFIGGTYGGALDEALTTGFGTYNADDVSKFSEYFVSDTEYYRPYLTDANEIALTNVWDLSLCLYRGGDGNYVKDTSLISYTYGTSAVALPSMPTRNGYSFEGWYDNEYYLGNRVTQIPRNTFGNKTYYAKWKTAYTSDGTTGVDNNLFGDHIIFGANNLWDCQRNPVYPLKNSPFYIFGLRTPLDVRGDAITLNDGEYVQFTLYKDADDVNGDGLITVSELSDADKNRIADSLYASSHASSRADILNAVVVSQEKSDGSGNATVLAKIGLIWALDETGFLYTALDPNCGWSYSGGVGTFISFDAHKAGDSITYVPDASDPLGKDDFVRDGTDQVVPVPVPEHASPTENVHSLVGKVIDQNGNCISGALVFTGATAYLDGEVNIFTDGNGYFCFDVLPKYIAADNTVKINVTKDSPTFKTYAVPVPTDGTVTIVYDTKSAGATENDTVSVKQSYRIIYKNMDGATPGANYPLFYEAGTGAALSDPTKANYSFEGWYSNAAFSGGKVTEISNTQTGDVMLYAKWNCVHAWSGEVTKKATCGQKGNTKYTCSVCGETKNEEIAALGHDWNNWAEIKSATCTEVGEEKRVCTHDGAHTETRETAALGHNYSTEYTLDVSPTCTQNGEKSRHCSRCGDRTDVTEVQALGHSYGEWSLTKQATKQADGEETRTCSVCGEKQTRPVKFEPGKKSLLWLIIVLAVIVAAEAVVLALCIRAKKKGGDGDNNENMGAYLPLLAVAYPTGEIVAIAVLAAVAAVLGIAIACTFIKKKKKKSFDEKENLFRD